MRTADPSIDVESDASAFGTVEQVDVRKWDLGHETAVAESIATEVPIGMNYNGRPYAVMLATPADLRDFAYGFAITERIIGHIEQLTLLDTLWTDKGVALDMVVPSERLAGLVLRERNLAGRTGCGLCGTSSLEAAVRPVRHVDRHHPVTADELCAAMEKLASQQPLNAECGALHAAALLTEEGGFFIREDVGRHNAIDKSVGATLLAGQTPRCLLVTSRASYEVVHKAAEVGCSVVAAISAPTALAVNLARQAGVTLIGWARPGRFTVFCGALA